ncbi:MAG: acetyl-CoA carboxylase biotin carboxyl carrier protein subunit [Longimicrobiales bacterium]
MRYFVTIDERTLEIGFESDTVIIDGKRCTVELHNVPGSAVRHLLIDGASHTLVAHQAQRGMWEIRIHGQRHEAEVLDARTRAIREMTGKGKAARGPRPVRAPMPGMVMRVEVEPGQSVAPGQGLVIVEAMKMENELKADGGGVVSRIHVAPGQPVEKGAILIEFEGADA